jgi:serine O-acetyltransferase
MITSKEDLKEYMQADLQYAYVPKKKFKRFLYTIHGNEQCHAYRYVRCLRLYEFHMNVNNKFLAAWYHFRLSRLGLRYGISINPNCADKGLIIIHMVGGTILNASKAGKYLRLQSGVVVGVDNKSLSPIIGDYVSFGLGSKAFGNIIINDYAKILPNAVVTHDVPKGAIMGGIPAKVIRYLTEEEINERRTKLKN